MEKEKTIAQAKPSISQDIIYDIFSRLPDKSFTRFKCVSKFCNSLVSFKVLAWTYPQKKFYTIQQKSMISDEFNLIGFEERIDRKGSAHLIKELNGFPYHKIDYIEGLFCLWNSNQLPPIIFNPRTRKVTYLSCQNLAEDEIDVYHIILGYDPEKKMHKILLMTYPHNYLMSSSRYWIFPLGTRRYFKMAAINLRAENFRIISLWNKYGRCYVVDMFDYIHLIEVKGKLAMVDVKGRKNERDNFEDFTKF
ncbi:hypothetical protein H5410_025215 [Solanum commersonii]|uniref:F-box domain-containing protein n=1 Tax=Solanum commersonii TaxID=4109 RepID=A0A9J5YSI0_SOLCO|nr:hypothetical protein H5410_025215 [Solanum commersonii]